MRASTALVLVAVAGLLAVGVYLWTRPARRSDGPGAPQTLGGRIAAATASGADAVERIGAVFR